MEKAWAKFSYVSLEPHPETGILRGRRRADFPWTFEGRTVGWLSVVVDEDHDNESVSWVEDLSPSLMVVAPTLRMAFSVIEQRARRADRDVVYLSRRLEDAHRNGRESEKWARFERARLEAQKTARSLLETALSAVVLESFWLSNRPLIVESVPRTDPSRIWYSKFSGLGPPPPPPLASDPTASIEFLSGVLDEGPHCLGSALGAEFYDSEDEL
ncbi:MAG TPA: hypothetical protein VEH57_08540 [Thermoplasmata archaeon]|nr:hypothetical protein [Thermoplasmata archaeon]